jgi:hypothetical protein
VVEVQGAHLSEALRGALRERHLEPEPTRTYTVATTGYLASHPGDKLGRVGARRPGPMLRDLTVAYLRTHGFSQDRPPAGS